MQEINLILKELKRVARELSEGKITRLVKEIVSAKKIYVLGSGRSGYVADSFIMRLKHLGFKTTNKPKENDLSIIISGSGKTKNILSKVKKIKSKKFCITMDRKSPIAKHSDFVIVIKAKKSLQPLRSLFEQETLIFLDAVILRLKRKLKISEKQMWKRHK